MGNTDIATSLAFTNIKYDNNENLENIETVNIMKIKNDIKYKKIKKINDEEQKIV